MMEPRQGGSNCRCSREDHPPGSSKLISPPSSKRGTFRSTVSAWHALRWFLLLVLGCDPQSEFLPPQPLLFPLGDCVVATNTPRRTTAARAP